MRVVFMGTPSYATTILKALVEASDIEVIAHFCQPDKPVGRKQILTSPDSKKFIVDNSHDIEVFQPKSLKSEEIRDSIKKLSPDFIVVAAYGKILPKSILDIAPCINLHASILPKYRGASPIQEAILNQDRFSGVSAMMMEEGLDCGDVLATSYIGIKDLNAIELFDKLAYMAAELTLDVLRDFTNIKAIKQNTLLVTHSKKIKKDDGRVHFTDAKSLYAKYLAYIFWPGVYLESGLKLKEIEFVEGESSNSAGEILEVSKDYVVVGCEKGSLKLKVVQAPSKKAVSIVDFIRGQRMSVGESLS